MFWTLLNSVLCVLLLKFQTPIHCQQNPLTPFCRFNHWKKDLISKDIVCCVGGKVKHKIWYIEQVDKGQTTTARRFQKQNISEPI